MGHAHFDRSRAPTIRAVLVALSAVAAIGPPRMAAQEGTGAGPVRLRLAPREGAVVEYRHEKRLDLRLPPGLGGAIATRTVLRLSHEVLETSADSIVLRAEILAIGFEADPAPPDLPDLGGLEGLQFRLVTTPAGRLYRVDLPGATGPVGRALRDQVESWLRELGFPALPSGPSRVGDRWTDTTRVPLAALLGLRSDAEVLEIRTTTLAALVDGPGGRLARLEVGTEWRGTEGPEDAPDFRVEGTGAQVVEFAVEEGRFRRAAGTSRVVMILFDGTGAEPRRIEATGRHETRLVMDGGEP